MRSAKECISSPEADFRLHRACCLIDSLGNMPSSTDRIFRVGNQDMSESDRKFRLCLGSRNKDTHLDAFVEVGLELRFLPYCKLEIRSLDIRGGSVFLVRVCLFSEIVFATWIYAMEFCCSICPLVYGDHHESTHGISDLEAICSFWRG